MQDTIKDNLALASSAHEGGSIGHPLDRIDGRAKVTGAALYAAEYPLEGLLHGVGVQAAIPKGQFSIDASAAENAPGVVRVFTHENTPRMPGFEPDPSSARFMRPVPVLQSDRIEFSGAYIALVIARTFEQAKYAADLVRVTYETASPELVLQENLDSAHTPEVVQAGSQTDTSVGDFEEAFDAAPVTVDATYTTPYEHNNPMEPHATTATWDGERLTLYDSTQAPNFSRTAIASTLNLDESQVRVVAKFIGGGFGSKYQPWSHVTLAALATKELGRPVKVVVGRRQMFTTTGHRPASIQRLRIGAGRDGRISAIAHDSFAQTSAIDEYAENTGTITRSMYAGENRRTTHRTVSLDLPTPNIMRAPGECPGSFALESAMDELAVALDADPVALRLRNEPERNPETGQPFSSRALVECLQEGADRFGWERRAPRPRSMQEGRTLIGYGVASASYPAGVAPSEAKVIVTADGRARVRCSASDLGTGTWTILDQVAADTLGFAPNQIEVEIGDTALPQAAGSGGSMAAASSGSAVFKACDSIRSRIEEIARNDEHSPLYGAPEDAVTVLDGRVIHEDKPSRSEPVEALLARNAAELPLETTDQVGSGDSASGYSMHSHGAHFVEVGVDEDTGEVRLRRLLGVYACGRILNQKTARSQFLGGMVMGAGMALMEESVVDERFGHFVNHDLAEYHVPVHADIAQIEAVMVPQRDDKVNPIGVKGVGEIGIVGIAAAIANAVHHATGIRVRELPITPDKTLA